VTATAAPAAIGGGTRPASRRRTTLLVVGAVLATFVVLMLHMGLAGAGVSPLVLVLLDSVPFVFLLATRPVLRRLAVRNAVRRPRETILVLVGSMLGTAIITGSFIVGDTLDASIRAGAFTRLGPVDEMVGTGSAETLRSLDERARGLPPSLVDGVLPFTSAAVTAANGTQRAEPSALLVEVDFDRARAFGGDEEATGIEGPTPAGDEVVIGRDLARALAVEPGATIDVFAYGTRRPMKVTRVLERRGVAGLLDPSAALGGGSRAPNLFVAPGTVEDLASRSGGAAAPPTFVLAVSNRGGVLEGAETTPGVVDALRPLVGADGTVRTVKADLVETAKESGDQFTSLFTSIGFFSVMAGILLLVNIFTALAQERKVSLGMLRAVGLRRASLVASFSLEGWIYALGSALLGALVGILVGRAIIFVAADIFSQGSEEFTLDLRYTFDSTSLTGGFTIGFVISLVTVVLSSLVIAKLNVIRAIRDLPEPPRTPKQRVTARIVGIVLALLGAVITAAGISGKSPEASLIGPSLLFLGLALALTFVLPSRVSTTIGALGTIVWAVLCFGLLPDVFETAEIPVFALQGVILVAAAVAALIVNLESIGRGVRTIGGGASAMSLRLGLAYPLARRFRTGAILAMYAMVVFILTFIVVLSTLFSTQADRFTRDSAGAFDVQVKSNETNPVPAGEVRALPGVEAVAELAITNVEFDAPGFSEGFEPWPVGGFDQVLADRGGPGLAKWDRERYPVEDDVWRLVAGDPGLIIIHEFFLQTGGGGPPQAAPEVGSKLTMRDPQSGRTRELTVAAVADGSFVSFHVHVSRTLLDEVVGERAVSNVLYADTVDAAAAQRVAGEVNARYLANGADSATFRSLVEEGLTAQTSFFRLMQGYIALGLVVGIAGLGVVMVRAVRERRRQVGVLRSLGFGSGQVRRAFLAEAGFIALLGILTGTVLAIIVAWRLIGTEAFGEDLPFSLPWGQLLVVIGLTFLFSLLATLAPAQQASAIRPAVALRMTD
jgi:putative ABC transport system permease protein